VHAAMRCTDPAGVGSCWLMCSAAAVCHALNFRLCMLAAGLQRDLVVASERACKHVWVPSMDGWMVGRTGGEREGGREGGGPHLLCRGSFSPRLRVLVKKFLMARLVRPGR
jgi:hypothetical protein